MARSLSEQYGVEIWPVYFNLADHDAVKAGVKEMFSRKRPIDILVNNAGIVLESRLFQMTPMDQMRQVMEINFFSQMLLTQLISRSMARQKSGSIVFLSSIAGLDGDPAQLEYVASKAAVAGAVKKLAHEFAGLGIRVNGVAPGLIDTDMGGTMSEEMTRSTVEAAVMRRLGRPEEIANVILFLASELASFMTGQILRVDGGR